MNGGKIQLCAAILLWALVLAAWKEGEVLDVQTLDGHFYRQAKLMSVNDGGISVLCADPKGGDPILRGITFDRLPKELRDRFGYDPEKFAVYQKKVGTYRPPEEKKKTSSPAAQPVQPVQPAAKPSDDRSGQVLGPSVFDSGYVSSYSYWDRPARRYWFGPDDLRPHPIPAPGPKPGPRPRPAPKPSPKPCPGPHR